jgi:D-glycero-alpha-D-manno-heptose-7-phosphate kinase
MLIARAPVRISFFGGGTDIPSYFEAHGGCVLSTSIDKYVYIVLNTSDGGALQITSSDYHTFYRHPVGEPLVWDGNLSLPRAVLQHFGVSHSVSMFIASEAPPGTGLGSSSAVSVALIKAISTACGINLTKQQLGEGACDIEIKKLSKPIGMQDQFASAFGGLNWISFERAGVTVQPIQLPMQTVRRLEGSLLMMFTGATHDSAEILKHQTAASKAKKADVMESMHAVKDLAHRGRDLLARGDLDQFGRLLHEAWQHKRRFAPGVTTPLIDNAYDVARNNGALGGKILGAGGGGFLLLYCEQDAIGRVERALEAEGLRRLGFQMENDGARVIFNAGLRLRDNSVGGDAVGRRVDWHGGLMTAMRGG